MRMREAMAPIEGVDGRAATADREVRLPTAVRAHLVGVCGSGMKALAELLAAMGWSVTGSDQGATAEDAARFARRGIRVLAGHHERFLPRAVDLLVYSTAVEAENPERRAARRRGIRQLAYSQMVGRLMRGKRAICVAGTHGKSTTTAMTGWILSAAGLAGEVLVGAEVLQAEASGWHGGGQSFVVESCEYERNFLHYSPQIAAILGIESDHFDCFPGLDDAVAAFAAFARKVPRRGLLVVPQGCAAVAAACASARAPRVTFGFSPDAAWRADNLVAVPGGTRFVVHRHGEALAEISLKVPGRHNVLNALAAAVVAFEAGASSGVIAAALGSFPGVKRRFERLPDWRGAAVIDDYAHHPTALRCTLESARREFDGRRLWCLFQPHQVSRTVALLEDFARSLALADRVLVTPVFAARERAGSRARRAGQALAHRAAELGTAARFQTSLDHARATLEDELAPGDVLVMAGAGDINRVYHAPA